MIQECDKLFSKYSIFLRALEEDDWKHSIHWRKNEIIWNMVAGHKYYVSEACEKQWVKNHIENQQNNFVFVVVEKESNKTIGFVYLININHKNKCCEFSKLLGDQDSWGKGYGTQMTMLTLYYAFYELGMERVEARQLLTNKASICVNKKCGFKNEGIARHALFKQGQFVDLNLMSCLREDYDMVIANYTKQENTSTI